MKDFIEKFFSVLISILMVVIFHAIHAWTLWSAYNVIGVYCLHCKPISFWIWIALVIAMSTSRPEKWRFVCSEVKDEDIAKIANEAHYMLIMGWAIWLIYALVHEV
uniref:Uncharacterized protein n=1 Tax=Myoviridae sp. ct0f722 TaxID=2827599 RepID=A0A8S5LPY6_9CAUD|nr:MAG TPA: hypothetical protein [Myoviridae sp. ct0f722]